MWYNYPHLRPYYQINESIIYRRESVDNKQSYSNQICLFSIYKVLFESCLCQKESLLRFLSKEYKQQLSNI